MEPQWPSLRDPDARTAWEAVLRPVAAQMQTCATELAVRFVDRYHCELPKLFPDASAAAEQQASTEASIRQIAQSLEAGDDPRRVDLAPATAALGRSGAQRDLPLPDLVRSVRLGQQQLWQWLFDQITTTTAIAERATALELATNWLFAYIDGLLMRAEQVYEIEREAWQGMATAARAAAVDDILAQREDDPQRASKRLRYNINRHHICVNAWLETTPNDHDAATALTDALAEIARAISAQSTLVHPVGSAAITGWLSQPQAFSTDELDAVRISGRPLLPHGVEVAIGEPGWGIEGFRRSHIEASHAQRVASLLGDRATIVTCYRDVGVAALATTDAEHAVAFVKRILGPLAAEDETTYRIATTLAVYLEENRSPTKAAQRLTVHPNTVSYRIGQAENLLGHPIDRSTIDLSVALAVLPMVRALTYRSQAGL